MSLRVVYVATSNDTHFVKSMQDSPPNQVNPAGGSVLLLGHGDEPHLVELAVVVIGGIREDVIVSASVGQVQASA